MPNLQAPVVGAPDSGSEVCEDLKKTRDATVKEELPPSKTKGATIAVGMATTPSGTEMMGGASSISKSTVKKGGKYAHWAQGVKKGQTSNVKTCDGKTFQYKQGGRPKEGHAEAKIIEDFFKGGGQGKLVLSITKKPCEDCQRLIDEVNKGTDGQGDCDIITVCK
ncbi:MAG: hypothetical protein AB1792_12125 [Candidatus Zixiibacteriota bacterium]